jgi:AcrR family transcriptional regulator
MPRTQEQNQRIRLERRNAILQAAVSLFARQGLDQTTMGDVARGAGVSYGSVFHYFATKDDLFRAAVLERADVLDGGLEIVLQSTGSPLGRIRHLITVQVRTVVEERSYLRLTQYVVSQPDRFPQLTAELSGFVDRFCRRLATVIEDGQRRGELSRGGAFEIALSYVCYLNGVALTILGDDPSSPLWEHVIDNGLRIFGPREEVDS